jgi:hypothetical protein
MSRKSSPYAYAPWSLTVVFLTLFIVYCVLYYTEINKKVDKQPIPVIPEWTYSAKTGNTPTTFTADDVLNAYVVKTSAEAAVTATFPTAASVVAAVAALDDRLLVVGQEFYMVLNNVSGQTITYGTGVGNTKTDLTTLATASYEIIKVVLTNITEGSEAVSYTGTYTGLNTPA